MVRGNGAFALVAVLAALALFGTPAAAAAHASSHSPGDAAECGDACPVCSMILAAGSGAAAVDAPPTDAARPAGLWISAPSVRPAANFPACATLVSEKVRLND